MKNPTSLGRGDGGEGETGSFFHSTGTISSRQFSGDPSTSSTTTALFDASEATAMLAGLGPLLPGGTDKRPTVGMCWTDHPGMTVAELQRIAPPCICWHIGRSPRHVAVDIDGPAVIEFCRKHGCDPIEADTWRIVRTSNLERLKLVFTVTPEQREVLEAGAKTVKIAGQELALFARPGVQIVVLGDHYTKESNHTERDDQYAWAGQPPANAQPLPAAWFQLLAGVFCGDRPLKPATARAVQTAPSKASRSASSNGTAWRNSSKRVPCPVCSRDHSGACSINRDGASVWCCHGETRSAPDCSRPGEVVVGSDGRQWGYVRTVEHDSFGERSLFTLHSPRQRAASSRQQRHQQPSRTDGATAPAAAPQAAHGEEDPADQQAQADAVESLLEAGRHRLTLAEVLPTGLAVPLAERAACFPCDPMALLLPMLCSAASVVGDRMVVKIKETWTEPFVLWGATVMPASSLKSPIAGVIQKPLGKWQADIEKQYKAERKQWADNRNRVVLEADKELLKNWESENPPPPPGRQLFIVDATLEKIGVFLGQENTPGMIAFHDELSLWFQQLKRGKDAMDQQGNWLSMWTGGLLKVDRIGRESIYVPSTAQSVYGLATVDGLAEIRHSKRGNSGNADASGLWARFLLWQPDDVPYSFNRLDRCVTDLLLDTFRNRIDAKLPGAEEAPDQPEALALSDAALRFMEPHWTRWDAESRQTTTERGQWLGKLRGHSVRLAGILHVLDRAAKDLPLTGEIAEEVAQRAVRLSYALLDQYDLLCPKIGGDTGDLPPELAKLLAKGIDWRKVHGTAPVPGNHIRSRWKLPDREATAKQGNDWLTSVIGTTPGSPRGWVEVLRQGIQWHPPA